MKKEDKVKIIKWFITNKCGLGKIQTEKNNTDNLKILEQLLMNDGAYPHYSNCCTCWYNNMDYFKKCSTCKNGSNYTFPYGYWEKFCERDR